MHVKFGGESARLREGSYGLAGPKRQAGPHAQVRTLRLPGQVVGVCCFGKEGRKNRRVFVGPCRSEQEVVVSYIKRMGAVVLGCGA